MKTASNTPFHKIGAEFIEVETSRDYAIEAFLFVLLVVLSAWPLVLMLQANVELLK